MKNVLIYLYIYYFIDWMEIPLFNVLKITFSIKPNRVTKINFPII